MDEYKGIYKQEHSSWKGWSYIALYESITDDFDNDAPLQKMVKRFYLKRKLFVIGFNLIPYIAILITLKV